MATFAVVACSSSAWAGNWGNNGADGTENSVYYVSATETKVDTTVGNQANITELYLAQAVDGDGATGSKAATIAELVLKNGDTLTVETHPWKEGNVNFSLLIIEEMTIGDGSGSASFNIDANQGVQIISIDGSISSLTNAGTLTLASAELAGSITNNGVLNIAGTLTGSGEIKGAGVVQIDTFAGGSFNGMAYTYADGSAATSDAGFVKGVQTFQVLGEGLSYAGDVYINGSQTPTTIGENGYVTVDFGDSNVFYVNDTWTYNADQSRGATSFDVSVIGKLNFAGGSTASGGLVINSEGAVTMSDETTMTGEVTINGGTFDNKDNKISGGTLVLNGLSSATISGDRDLSLNLELVNTYLRIGTGDTLDYDDGGNLTYKIGSGATLDVQGNRQSVRSNHIIEMAGGTLTGAGASIGNHVYGIDFYSGGRFNTSADSLIATNVGGHDGGNVRFDVNTGKTLTMTGNLVGVGTFSKTAGGTMVYKGAAFTQALTIEKGVFEYYVNTNAENKVETRNHNGTISGSATLRKSGAGVLNLSSSTVSVTKFDVTGGTLGYNLVSGEKSITLTGSGGTFVKSGAGTVNLGALVVLSEQDNVVTSYNYDGVLRVTEGKVVFTSLNAEQAAAPPAFVKLVNNLTTEGDGLVEIVGDVKFNYNGDNTPAANCVITMDDNLHIAGNLEINSWGSGNAPDRDGMRRWNVNRGGNIAVDGHLWLTNQQKMVINGGHVSALNGVRLGHEQNSTEGRYKSKFVLEDGSLTTSSFTFYAGGSEIIMSGGELIFTPATNGDSVLKNSYGGNTPGINKLTITGGTLKATDSSWALTGSSTNIVSLGNVTFDIASGKTVTLSGNIALTGSVEAYGKGELQLGNTTFSIAEQDLNSFTVCRGEVADSSHDNGLGGRVYSVLWGTGSIAQLDGTNLSVLIGGAAAGDRWNADTFEITSSATNDFIINTQFETSQATAANGAVGADSFIVNKGGTFTVAGDITDGKTAKELVMETLGSGTMSLTTDVSLSHSGDATKFHGNLDVKSDVTLTLGRVFNTGADPTSSNTVEYDVDVSSLAALNLNGGTLKMYYVAPHIKSMSVNSVSSILIDDTWKDCLSNKLDATRIDSLTLNSSLSLTTNWKSSVNIGVLSGFGDLTVSQTETVNEGKTSNLWIDDVDNYTGTISVSGKMALTLNIGENESLNSSQLSVSGELAGATLTGSGEYNLGSATSLGSGVSVGDAWTGTVTITNASANGTSLASLGNASSKIAINGLSGWIQRENVASHVVLGANGLTLTAYSTDSSYNFAGGISGAGDFILDSSSAANPHFSIGSNGTSEWKGGFIVKNMVAGTTAELKMVGGGELMAADSKGVQMNSNNGTLSLIIGNADVATTMNGAVSKNANGSLNMTVQGDTVFNAGINVSQLTLSGSGVTVTLSGEQNTINGSLAVTAGNGLTLEDGSALTVNNAIQNAGTLDIKGSVHWTDTSMAGLTMTYTPDLDRTTNGLGSGVISGLITGTGSLTDNGVVDASFNGWTGSLDTATGLVTADGLVYYVMNSPKFTPQDPQGSRDGLVYSFGNGQEVLLSNVVHVGVYDSDRLEIPQANSEANSAHAYYVGDNGILAIMGNPDVSAEEKMNDAQRIGDILESTQGRGDIILSTPGYTVSGIDTVIVSVDSATQAEGSLYLAPYVLDESAANVSQAGIFLHLNKGADISSFSSVHYGYPQSQIVVNGIIGADAETGTHINDLSAVGCGIVFLCIDKGANNEIVLGGTTTIAAYKHGTMDLHSGILDVDFHHENSLITIEQLSGKKYKGEDDYSALKITTGMNDNYDGEDVSKINGVVDIKSFDYEGFVTMLPMEKNDTLHLNINLEDSQVLRDGQVCIIKIEQNLGKVSEGTATFTIKGSGTYVLGQGNSMDWSSSTTYLEEYNFGVLDAKWKGTVQVNNLDASGKKIAAVSGINPADYGNADSTVDFIGFKGYLNDANLGDADMNVLFDMVLTNTSSMNGFELTNASSGNALIFEGDIRGTGDFVVSMADAEGANQNETIHFKGDLSGWAPVENGSTALIVKAGEQSINFSDKATVINADLRATGGTMNASISNDAAVTVNGAVYHEPGGTLNMTVNTAQGTTFNGSVDIDKLVVSKDSVANVAAGASVGEVGIQSRFEGVAVLKDNMTIEGNSVSGGSALNAALSFQTDGSVSSASLEDVSLSSLKAAASIELSGITAKNVYLAGEANFVSLDDQANFQYKETIVAYERQYNEVSFSTDSYSGMILAAQMVGDLTQMEGDLTLTVSNKVDDWANATADALTNVTIKLDGFRVEGMEDGQRVDKWFEPLHILLSDSAASVDVELAMTVNQLLDVDSYAYVFYEQQADGLVIRMSNIPEPSTATLSLLALAALAARRRRK